MPSKSSNPPLPYLDPEFVPEHPANHIPGDLRSEEQKYWLKDPTPAERKRQEREWLKTAMAGWDPPHVLRSWENRPELADARTKILSLTLPPKPAHQFLDLVPANPNDSSVSRVLSKELYDPRKDPLRRDFRKFMNYHFQLGYHRFHASHGDPGIPSEESDPRIDPDDICWIMEYTDVECSTVRRRMAFMMGLFPAVIDEENELFNEEIAWRYGETRIKATADQEEHIGYGRRLYVRCRRRHKKCVRPSHIVLFGSDFGLVP